jgi:hypothetical protein
MEQCSSGVHLEDSAYFFGSLPSHTVPSNSLLVRIASLGTLTLHGGGGLLVDVDLVDLLGHAR